MTACFTCVFVTTDVFLGYFFLQSNFKVLSIKILFWVERGDREYYIVSCVCCSNHQCNAYIDKH